MPEILWEKQAEKALTKVPFFVRGMVRRKVGERVRKSGRDRVTIEDFREAEARFRAVAGNKSDDELKRMVPMDNVPGVGMVVVESCHNELSGCPNVLIKTTEWRKAIEDWIAESGVSEKLRERVRGDKILYHHKLKISISGCPNGCSRPQIADFGIVGYVEPDVDPADCMTCGACGDECPDEAITVEGGPPVFDLSACRGCIACRDICPNGCISLSGPRVRILTGGKLGRHPHLAEVAGSAATPEELIGKIDSIVNGFIENSEDGERFADYWIRRNGEV